MTVHVREATPEELGEAGRVVAGAYLADGAVAPDDPYLDTLADTAGRAQDSVVLVAVEGVTVLGTVTWCPRGSSHREISLDDEGEFRSLGVRPDARGRGVGELLVQACLDRARDAGYRAVAICSADWMTSAHRLYAHLGFTRLPERDWTPVPHVSLLAYRLDLEA